MKSYPIMLNIQDKKVVIVGGGRIAYRKIVNLLQAGARITVISPAVHIKIEKLITENRIIWKKKAFESDDLECAFIVIAATNNEKVNAHVASSAGANQLVNIVDNQEISTFHVPAKLTRGDLTISIATSGASPTLAKVIRDELALVYDNSYERYLEFLSQSRVMVKNSNCNPATKIQLLKVITGKAYRESVHMQQAFLEAIENFEEKL